MQDKGGEGLRGLLDKVTGKDGVRRRLAGLMAKREDCRERIFKEEYGGSLSDQVAVDLWNMASEVLERRWGLFGCNL